MRGWSRPDGYFGSEDRDAKSLKLPKPLPTRTNSEWRRFSGVICEIRNLKLTEGDMHAAADLTGQANHLGVTIQADIIKQKLPTNNGGYNALNIESSYGKTNPKVYTDLTTRQSD